MDKYCDRHICYHINDALGCGDCLLAKIKQLEADNKDLAISNDFYADKNNYGSTYTDAHTQVTFILNNNKDYDTDWSGFNETHGTRYGGKLARETQRKIKERNQ